MFCPECDAVLVLKKMKKCSNQSQKVQCRDCGYEVENNMQSDVFLIQERIIHGVESLIEIIETDDDNEKITSEMREELRERYRESPIYLT